MRLRLTLRSGAALEVEEDSTPQELVTTATQVMSEMRASGKLDVDGIFLDVGGAIVRLSEVAAIEEAR